MAEFVTDAKYYLESVLGKARGASGQHTSQYNIPPNKRSLISRENNSILHYQKKGILGSFLYSASSVTLLY